LASKGDKKKKKETTEEIAKLEHELDARHDQELADLKNKAEPKEVSQTKMALESPF
jgi:hypothetical protein